uniref:RlsD n=1 Tax=Volvox ferrisii TaxID=1075618 RepID=A0A075M2H6_9CHLO|nr:RlsD [Volvox ferrisii]
MVRMLMHAGRDADAHSALNGAYSKYSSDMSHRYVHVPEDCSSFESSTTTFVLTILRTSQARITKVPARETALHRMFDSAPRSDSLDVLAGRSTEAETATFLRKESATTLQTSSSGSSDLRVRLLDVVGICSAETDALCASARNLPAILRQPQTHSADQQPSAQLNPQDRELPTQQTTIREPSQHPPQRPQSQDANMTTPTSLPSAAAVNGDSVKHHTEKHDAPSTSPIPIINEQTATADLGRTKLQPPPPPHSQPRQPPPEPNAAAPPSTRYDPPPPPTTFQRTASLSTLATAGGPTTAASAGGGSRGPQLPQSTSWKSLGATPSTGGANGEGFVLPPGASLPPPVEVTVAVRLNGAPPLDEEPRCSGYGYYVRGPACGVFDPELYVNRHDCIRYEGMLVSRSHFEKLGGSNMAKWYRSIRVLPELEPLGEWLERHGLPVIKGAARRSRPRKLVVQSSIAANGGFGPAAAAAKRSSAAMASLARPCVTFPTWQPSTHPGGGDVSGDDGAGGDDGDDDGGEYMPPPSKRRAGSAEVCSSSCADGEDGGPGLSMQLHTGSCSLPHEPARGGYQPAPAPPRPLQRHLPPTAAAAAAAVSMGPPERPHANGALGHAPPALAASEPNDDEAEGTAALMFLSSQTIDNGGGLGLAPEGPVAASPGGGRRAGGVGAMRAGLPMGFPALGLRRGGTAVHVAHAVSLQPSMAAGAVGGGMRPHPHMMLQRHGMRNGVVLEEEMGVEGGLLHYPGKEEGAEELTSTPGRPGGGQRHQGMLTHRSAAWDGGSDGGSGRGGGARRGRFVSDMEGRAWSEGGGERNGVVTYGAAADGHDNGYDTAMPLRVALPTSVGVMPPVGAVQHLAMPPPTTTTGLLPPRTPSGAAAAGGAMSGAAGGGNTLDVARRALALARQKTTCGSQQAAGGPTAPVAVPGAGSGALIPHDDRNGPLVRAAAHQQVCDFQPDSDGDLLPKDTDEGAGAGAGGAGRVSAGRGVAEGPRWRGGRVMDDGVGRGLGLEGAAAARALAGEHSRGDRTADGSAGGAGGYGSVPATMAAGTLPAGVGAGLAGSGGGGSGGGSGTNDNDCNPTSLAAVAANVGSNCGSRQGLRSVQKREDDKAGDGEDGGSGGGSATLTTVAPVGPSSGGRRTPASMARAVSQHAAAVARPDVIGHEGTGQQQATHPWGGGQQVAAADGWPPPTAAATTAAGGGGVALVDHSAATATAVEGDPEDPWISEPGGMGGRKLHHAAAAAAGPLPPGTDTGCGTVDDSDDIDDMQLQQQLATVGAPALLLSIEMEQEQLIDRLRQLERLQLRIEALQQATGSQRNSARHESGVLDGFAAEGDALGGRSRRAAGGGGCYGAGLGQGVDERGGGLGRGGMAVESVVGMGGASRQDVGDVRGRMPMAIWKGRGHAGGSGGGGGGAARISRTDGFHLAPYHHGDDAVAYAGGVDTDGGVYGDEVAIGGHPYDREDTRDVGGAHHAVNFVGHRWVQPPPAPPPAPPLSHRQYGGHSYARSHQPAHSQHYNAWPGVGEAEEVQPMAWPHSGGREDVMTNGGGLVGGRQSGLVQRPHRALPYIKHMPFAVRRQGVVGFAGDGLLAGVGRGGERSQAKWE